MYIHEHTDRLALDWFRFGVCLRHLCFTHQTNKQTNKQTNNRFCDPITGPPEPAFGCQRTDVVQQFFLAKTAALVARGWDDKPVATLSFGTRLAPNQMPFWPVECGNKSTH
jgi:hypothetical protein